MPMTGADIIVKVLAEQGVDTIFGYSGGAILPTYDAIFRHNAEQESSTGEPVMNLVVPATEQGAGFMAAGYARATGKVGVFIVTSGPGATNSVTPIRDCLADSVPVVLICGQVSRAAIGTDAFQEAPVFNIMTGCAKSVFLVLDPEELEATVRTAFELARSGRPGPVVIDIPKDVQTWRGEFRGEGVLSCGYRSRTKKACETRVSPEKCAAFFDLLRKSRRPLIYAGGGVIRGDASYELWDFATTLEIPVVTTLQAIGAFDTTHPLSLQMLGMHGTPYANYAVEDCDFLIAVGARFDDRVAGNAGRFAPNAKNIAHIDIDAAEIGKVKRVTWSLVGTAKHALQDLVAHGRDFGKRWTEWVTDIQALKRDYPMDYDRDSVAIQPCYVIELLNEITRGEAIICTGVGQHQMWAAQYFDYKHARTFLTSGSMGTMGFGLPAAIGAQIAYPERLVVDVDGDASLRMNIGELETAATYKLPVKILLLNNTGDGMVRQWQKMFYSERFCGTDKSLHKKDFIKAAAADGFEFASRVTEKHEVRDALACFVEHKGPALLEVIIDREAAVYPMIVPGQAYSQMVTGDRIRSRPARVSIAVEKTSSGAF